MVKNWPTRWGLEKAGWRERVDMFKDAVRRISWMVLCLV
jgi:hypothetical protein